ncbi:MAG: acylphosphatase [Candidatus Levybacteria bacterium]|nr:acylphosphatase [Candidatus Levybacteria bacterium]
MQQAHVFISGFVQGVGFRHFVRQKARQLGLTGWVRNLPDRRVEAVFQQSSGKVDKVEQVIKECRKGPFLSEVEEVRVEWEETKEKFEGFEILLYS